ncbi:YecR family lipoprotein [Ruegeria sp. A3M17]|uniref:YecR family lipoprotein n=1 Tax=Ruegeria sp. A3M17 TaxID=2267229 RepID=UPI000DEAD1CD|nr:hypothetical protein DS906_13910 [Ruegeria sp. A3M17]
MKLNYIFIVATVLVAACEAQTIVPVPTSGSRDDANVVLSYNTGLYAPTTPDWAQAQASADARCKAWGYSKADPFQGTSQQCHSRNGYGQCLEATISRTYQCLGRG